MSADTDSTPMTRSLSFRYSNPHHCNDSTSTKFDCCTFSQWRESDWDYVWKEVVKGKVIGKRLEWLRKQTEWKDTSWGSRWYPIWACSGELRASYQGIVIMDIGWDGKLDRHQKQLPVTESVCLDHIWSIMQWFFDCLCGCVLIECECLFLSEALCTLFSDQSNGSLHFVCSA